MDSESFSLMLSWLRIFARHLYERLGFQQLGTIPSGFRMKDGYYVDICPFYHTL